MPADRTARCLKSGCCKTWPRDPALEVKCPHCLQLPGRYCERPSQHKIPFSSHGFFHAARDILADKEGKYGACPSGRCGKFSAKIKEKK